MNGKTASLLVLCATACSAIFPLPNVTFGQGPSQSERSVGPLVVVKIHVIELNPQKIRRLGVDFRVPLGTEFLYPFNDEEDHKSDASRVLGFCDALRQFDCARIIAEPQLVMATGREGSLEIDDHLRLKILPLKVDNRKVELEYSLALSHVDANRVAQDLGNRQLVIASNFVGDMGKTHCLSASKRWTIDDQDVPHERLLLVLLSADYPPAEVLDEATRQTDVPMKDLPQR